MKEFFWKFIKYSPIFFLLCGCGSYTFEVLTIPIGPMECKECAKKKQVKI